MCILFFSVGLSKVEYVLLTKEARENFKDETAEDDEAEECCRERKKGVSQHDRTRQVE